MKIKLKDIIKNYKSTIILLVAIVLGALIGAIFKEDALVLKPFGTLLLNFLLVSVVPLVFFSISSSIVKMDKVERLGKILRNILIVFLGTSVIAVVVSLGIGSFIELVNIEDTEVIKSSFDEAIEEEEIQLNLLERTVDMVSLNNTGDLLSTSNILALIVIAVMVGLSTNMAKEEGKALRSFLISANEVTLKFVGLIMCYAPIGIMAYIAALVGELGSIISVGYLKTGIVYLVITLVVYFGVYGLYAFIAGGKKGVKAFAKSVVLSSATALGTCSSAASVPVNIECTKKIGVPDDIAETTISLGTSFHKDGSTIGNVIKILFLASLFGLELTGFGGFMQIMGISMLAMLLISAVPIGGGTIAEMLIITMLGVPVAALPILTIISVIIDAPATLLNVVGDSSSAMLVSRMSEGKDWMEKKKNKELETV